MLELENQRNIQLTSDGMEIEMDLSVTKATGNLTFASTETETVFILLGHLPGFLQDKIEVSVNETGTEISINGAGEKSSFETVIGSRLRLKNEFENSSFRKVFRIPDDVLLDQINACFCEDEAILMIVMPKSIISEVSGREIQEVEEQEEAPKEKETEGDTKIQIGTASSASDRTGDGGPEHMEAENNVRREKQKEPGKNTDVPESPLADTETLAAKGEPACPATASKAIDEEGHEEPAEKESSQNQQSEQGNEKHESTEADRDLDQPKGRQKDREQQMEQKENARDMDQPEEKEQKAESTEAPKPNGDLHQTEETSEMVKGIEAPVLEEHEVAHSIEADRDREQPKEKKDPEPKTVQAAETNEMEQKDREQVSESIETPNYEEPPEMDQRTEAPIEEEDEEGGRNGNRQKASIRKKKKDRDVRAPAPSLMFSAFVLSLVALVVELVRSRRRR